MMGTAKGFFIAASFEVVTKISVLLSKQILIRKLFLLVGEGNLYHLGG